MPLQTALHVRLGAVLLAAVAAAGPATVSAQDAATHLLVADRDASPGPGSRFGALFNVDLAAPSTAAPTVEAGAALGAPFEFLTSVALSPLDGRAYLADIGLAAAGIHVVDGRTGVVTTLTRDARLVAPWDVTVMSDGNLAIADAEADPSGLGPDTAGNAGHGAIFIVDEVTGALSVLADGTLHAGFPGVPVGESAFEDPVAVAHDPDRDVLYVVDGTADPLDIGGIGAVYAVDSSGQVTIVSQSDAFIGLVRVAVRADGKLLVVDALENDQNASTDDSIVYIVDPDNDDPQDNLTEATQGSQYGLLEGVAVDAAGGTFLADSGLFNGAIEIMAPRIWRLDPANPNLSTNGVVVNESTALIYPIAVAAVPGFELTSVTPSTVPSALPSGCGVVTVRVNGTGLVPGLDLDFGPGAIVRDVRWPVVAGGVGASVDRSGRSLEVDLQPIGSGTLTLSASHPFGETETLSAALVLQGDASAITPRPPCSPAGDGNCDGIVDGLDLALLGRHFGTSYCEGLAFHEDSDYNDDDIIDGLDLALLASFFGQQT